MKHRRRPIHRNSLTLLPVLVLMFALLPVTPASATSGYREIGTSTVLTADHDGQIEIVANNVTLDCAGHVVSWTGEEAWFGIGILERTGVTVENCEVSGDYGFGIISFFGSNNTVMGSTVHGNDKGIALHQSPGSSAIGNEVYENDNYGIGAHLSDEVVVSSNTAWDNGGTGIAIWGNNAIVADNLVQGNFEGITLGSDGSEVIGNEAYENSENGLRLGNSYDNTISNNMTARNGVDGIYLSGDDSDGNTVTGNTATENLGAGIAIDFGDDNVLTGNDVSGNGRIGLLLGEADGNTVIGNTATGNGEDGFHLTGANGNTLTGNQAEANGWMGFLLISSSTGNTLTDNTASTNGTGFALGEADDNTLTDNSATDNDSHGFFLADAANNTLRDNSSSGDGYGFWIEGGHANTLVENKASRNGERGFVFWSSHDNVIRENSATRNARSGFAVEGGSSGNEFIENSASKNTAGLLIVDSGDTLVKENKFCGNSVVDVAEFDLTAENTYIENRVCTFWPGEVREEVPIVQVVLPDGNLNGNNFEPSTEGFEYLLGSDPGADEYWHTWGGSSLEDGSVDMLGVVSEAVVGDWVGIRDPDTGQQAITQIIYFTFDFWNGSIASGRIAPDPGGQGVVMVCWWGPDDPENNWGCDETELANSDWHVENLGGEASSIAFAYFHDEEGNAIAIGSPSP